MSEEIEEVWPVSDERIEKAFKAWQNDDPAETARRRMTEAEALEEAFLNHDIQFVPVADHTTDFMVEVDGRAVGRSGSKWTGTEFTGPFSANDALGIWLNVNHEHLNSDPFPQIVLRTATAEEMAEDLARQVAAVDEILRPA